MTRLRNVLLLAVLVLAVGGCSMIQGLLGGMSGPALAVGTPTQGTLEASDRTDIFQDGSYTDIYQLTLTQGQQVTIMMESPTFDTFLAVLQGRNQQLASNDDGIPGTTNSRIDFTPASAGTYYIAATSLGSGITGAYTVTASAAGATPPTATTTPTTPPATPPATPPPATPPTAPPAAGGGGCAQYATCCQALSQMQGMEAMAASCAQIEQLRASPAGDQACNSALQSIRMMPNAPPACAQ